MDSVGEKVVVTLPILLIGVALYAVNFFVQRHAIAEVRSGLWLLTFFAFLYLDTYLGSFGAAIIPAPWDSVLAAVGGLACYRWGVAEGTRHMARNPEIAEGICEAAEESVAEPGAAHH